jgi:hypothetical protein
MVCHPEMSKGSYKPPKRPSPKENSKMPVSLSSVASQNESLPDSQPNGRSIGTAYIAQSQAEEKPVDSYMKEERDFKSYAVKEYDAHQETAKKNHGEDLQEVVKRVS